MSSTLIPRTLVSQWSDDIGENRARHQTSLNGLAKYQKRLLKFIHQNPHLHESTRPYAREFVLVTLRIFDLAGGRMKVANLRHIEEAQERLRPVAGSILPFDAEFPERVRAIEWRAQPNILDEALEALFSPGPFGIPKDEVVKVFFSVWLAVEVASRNWTPRPEFTLEAATTEKGCGK